MGKRMKAMALTVTEDMPDDFQEGNYWLTEDGNTLFVVLPGLPEMCPLPLNDQSDFAAEVNGRWTFDPATVTVTPSIHRQRTYTVGGKKTLWHGWLRDGYFVEV